MASVASSRWRRGWALLRTMRPHNGLACSTLVWAGCWRGEYPGSLTSTAILGTAVFLLAGGAHVLNDLLDRSADRINRPARPLARGDLSACEARRGTVNLLAAGVLLGLVAEPAWWSWWFLWLLAGLGYSLLAKGCRWFGPLWTAAAITSCYLPGAGHDGWQLTDTLVALVLLHFLFFRELVKVLEDSRGDGAAGYRTLAGGWWDRHQRHVLLALPLVLVAALLSLLGPAGLGGRVAGLVFLGSLVAALVVLPSSRRRGRHRAGSLLKISAVSGLVHLVLLPREVIY